MKRQPINHRNLDNNNPEPRYGKMKTLVKYTGWAAMLALFMLPVTSAQAEAFVQCPGDNNGDATIDDPSVNPNAVCLHLSGSDGFANMGDGYLQYIFGFGVLTETPGNAIDQGIFHANISAPTIELAEGEEFYLTLTNTGMANRPDLFDPHTVHFHGFPNASSVFDGLPDASISVNMGASLTYWYNLVEPGTYMYHCHVEAAEHMQMGMLGNLYVRPAQNGTPIIFEGETYTQFAYNDGDGSTGYDVEMPLQVTGFDPDFHDASMNTQPLPFANMNDRYHMFNGRGYPVTTQGPTYYDDNPGAAQDENATLYYPSGYNSQPVSSKRYTAPVTAPGVVYDEVEVGEKLLLRISNLSITSFYTVRVLGLPMHVVGQGARELVDKYDTASVNLGGGESFDVIVDTADVDPGTYHVFVTELDRLSNNNQAFGGPMTEIVVVADRDAL